MTCPDCLARLAGHWDEPRTEVAQHLRDCAACRGEWERLSAALELLEQEPRPAAPDLRAAIWAQLA
ncbi:MAG: hypothetical protein HUU35_18435, partial [Armatimonadetes bacterium]|nr:hypothetical protein [Armatimonadota bacterium]